MRKQVTDVHHAERSAFGGFFTQKLDQASYDSLRAGAAPDTNLPFRPFNTSISAAYIHTFGPGH